VKIAVISDLHLCSDRSCREFTFDEPFVLGLFDRLEARHDHIFVVGDLYNLEHSRKPFDWAGELEATWRRYPRLTARLHGGAGYFLVHGNHDRAIAELLGVPEHLRLELGGSVITVTHGHKLDGWLKQLPWVAPTGAWVEAWLRRAHLGKVADSIVDVGRLAARVGTPSGGVVYRGEFHGERSIRLARELLLRERSDVVMMGHTHLATAAFFPEGGIYLNGGGCAFGELSYVSCDLASAEAVIHRYEGGQWTHERTVAKQAAGWSQIVSEGKHLSLRESR